MQQLEEFIDSDEFGSGKMSGYVYAAGLVGRIPRKRVLQPEFPQCLDYLRRSQLSDGSWGSQYPVLIFDRIISTLSAIVCLKFWDCPVDTPLIENGCKYIKMNLDNIEMPNDNMTVGFELLLLTPIGQSLRQKAKQNNQTLAQELADVLAEFEKIPTEQIAQLSEASQKTPLQMLTYLLQEIPTEEIAQVAKASQRPLINMIVHLVLLGLRVYKRYLARMDQAIDESAID